MNSKVYLIICTMLCSAWSRHFFNSFPETGEIDENRLLSDFDPTSRASQKDDKYRWDYTVSDMKTGDAKSHWESKEGDQVKGEYVLLDADGSIRKVSYIADKNGFLANVQRTIPHRLQNHHSIL